VRLKSAIVPWRCYCAFTNR